MTTFEEMPSVKTAVDREAQRRKRVFATFLALLIIPIAIGAYAIARAPSETDAVVSKVTPLVQERVEKNVEETITARVDRTVEPRVAEIVERRATPVIERTLDKQVKAAVTARVQPLEQNYRMLAARNTEHDKTATRVQELEKRVAMLERQIAVLTKSAQSEDRSGHQDRSGPESAETAVRINRSMSRQAAWGGTPVKP